MKAELLFAAAVAGAAPSPTVPTDLLPKPGFSTCIPEQGVCVIHLGEYNVMRRDANMADDLKKALKQARKHCPVGYPS